MQATGHTFPNGNCTECWRNNLFHPEFQAGLINNVTLNFAVQDRLYTPESKVDPRTERFE